VTNEQKIGEMINQIDELKYELDKSNRRLHRLEAVKSKTEVPVHSEDKVAPAETSSTELKTDERVGQIPSASNGQLF
jgi:hypothetical protein